MAIVSKGTPHSVERYQRGRTRVIPAFRSSSSNSARIGSRRVPSMVSPRSLIGVDHRFDSWNRPGLGMHGAENIHDPATYIPA